MSRVGMPRVSYGTFFGLRNRIFIVSAPELALKVLFWVCIVHLTRSRPGLDRLTCPYLASGFDDWSRLDHAPRFARNLGTQGERRCEMWGRRTEDRARLENCAKRLALIAKVLQFSNSSGRDEHIVLDGTRHSLVQSRPLSYLEVRESPSSFLTRPQRRSHSGSTRPIRQARRFTPARIA
jgi:hypothetical protein